MDFFPSELLYKYRKYFGGYDIMKQKVLSHYYFLLVYTLCIMVLGGLVCASISANIGITLMFILNMFAFIFVIVKKDATLSAPVRCKCCAMDYPSSFNFCPICGTKQFVATDYPDMTYAGNDTADNSEFVKSALEMESNSAIDIDKIEVSPKTEILEEPSDLTDDLPQSENIAFDAKDFL